MDIFKILTPGLIMTILLLLTVRSLNQSKDTADLKFQNFLRQLSSKIVTSFDVFSEKTFQSATKTKLISPVGSIESCQIMLNSGKWSREINKTEAIDCTSNIICRTSIWNTETECKLKQFTVNSTRSCLKNQRVFVVGDSRARQVEISFLSRLTPNLSVIDLKDPNNTVSVNF